MNFWIKWRLRQAALELLLSLFRLTPWLGIVVLVRFWEFRSKGMSMYFEVLPKGWTLTQCLSYFYDMSVWPYLKLLPFTLALDALIRTFVQVGE